jgi:hypothetical protein
LWLSLFVLLGSGWFLRSLSRRSSSFSHRQNVLLIVGYVVWVAMVIALMMWIGDSKADVVGPLFVPVAVVLSVAGAFSDDFGRLVRRAKGSKKID